jgi:CheY-like chemotaxis protein
VSPEQEPRPGKPRVLIVDDEEDIVEYVKTVLEDNGYEAMGAQDAGEAFEAIARWKPGLILLDIMMPQHSGLSLYEAVRKNEATAGLPILIVSGYARPEEFRRIETGVLGAAGVPPPDGYLEKPISVPLLLETIRALALGAPGGGA